VKLAAFTIAAFIAGVAGVLYVYNFLSVSADSFDVLTALSLVAFAYAGGITLISGAVFAGLISAQLSMSQRKLVGVARALAAKPRLLCLDEPAAGLDTRESGELGACLRGLADQGQPMLLIEHDMGLVLGICDRVIVLESGRVIAEGPPEAVRRDPRVVAAYLGDGVTGESPAADGAAGDSGTGDGGIMATLADEQAE
jgi:branched-chain amino acid transport system ATP-binding protein